VLTISLFFIGSSGLGTFVLVSASIALTDSSGFASQSAQVVELGSSNATSLNEVDVIDNSCVKREYSFDTHAEACFPHGNRFASATMFASDHDALESLESFFGFRLFDSNMYTHSIARLKSGNVCPQLRRFYSV
jgi:hypothetical protein